MEGRRAALRQRVLLEELVQHGEGLASLLRVVELVEVLLRGGGGGEVLLVLDLGFRRELGRRPEVLLVLPLLGLGAEEVVVVLGWGGGWGGARKECWLEK